MSPHTHSADRNLLIGIIAFQMDFISRDQLIAAMHAWVLSKASPLSQILLDQGALSDPRRALLDALVDEHIKLHAGDPQRSLAAVSSIASVRHELSRIPDQELQASLPLVSAARARDDSADDLFRTQNASVGESTTPGVRFRILRPHAKGGLGQVSVALDTELDRPVALKEIQEEHADDQSSRVRFVQEAEITGKLEHPGIVPVYGLGRYADGRPFYAMRFVQGYSLKEAIELFHQGDSLARDHRQRTLRLRELLGRFTDVCNAIAYAHSRGILHRDLKPGNVMLGPFGETLIVDWGLAKQMSDGDGASPAHRSADHHGLIRLSGLSGSRDGTLPGKALGTPAFTSPEQAEGRLDLLGPQSDVYSLGATLYAVLTGRAPFGGDGAANVLPKIGRGEFAMPRTLIPSIPRPLEAICVKAMALRQADRYATPRALAQDIEHWLADEPVSAWREPWATRARRWVSRHRTSVAAGVAAMAVAVVGLALALTMQAQANSELKAALEREFVAREDAADQSRQAEAAIDSFYGRVTEDVILRRPELEKLRQKLLGEAIAFYKRRVDSLGYSTFSGNGRAQTIVAGLDRVASLQALLGDRNAAIETRRHVLEVYDANPQLNPDGAVDTELSIGNLLRLVEKPDDAVRSLRQALKRAEGLSNEPKTAVVQADLGRLLFDIGQSDEARLLLQRALETQERFAEAGAPSANLAATYTTLGNLDDAEGRIADALAYFEKTAEMYRGFALRTSQEYYHAEFARALNNLGLGKAMAGKLQDGRRDIDEGKEIRERLLADQPLNVEYRSDLARSYYRLARVNVLAGATADAIESIRRCEEMYTGIPPKGPEDIYFKGCIKALVCRLVGKGKSAQELSPAERTDQERFALEAIALLKQAAAAGFSNPSHYKNDPALVSLRSRPDFRELVQSLSRPRG
jgi:serine/threonine-protein kinase